MGRIVLQASRPAGASEHGALAVKSGSRSVNWRRRLYFRTCAVLWEVLDSMVGCGGVKAGGEGFEAENQAEVPIAEKATEETALGE